MKDESIEECTTTPLLLSTPSVFVGMTSDGKFIRVLSDMIVLYNETPQQIHFEDRCTAACCNGEILLAVIHSQDGSTLLCYQHINGKFHEIDGESFIHALTAVTIDRADPARICAVGNSEETILVQTLTNTEENPILSTVAMQTFESPVTSLLFETSR